MKKSNKRQSLKFSNNWEYITYLVKDLRVENVKFVYIQGKKYPVTKSTGHSSYSDMGHNHNVDYPDFTVKVPFLGKTKTISLKEALELKIKVEVDEKDLALVKEQSSA